MKKILFIRLSSLGDVVLTESTIRLAKEYFPDCEIHFLTKPVYTKLVESFEGVSKVYAWVEKPSIFISLRKEIYDFVIDLHNKFNTFLIKLILCRKTITYNKQRFDRWLMTQRMTTERIDSVVWNYLDVLKKVVPSDKGNINIDKILMNKTFYPKLRVEKYIVDAVRDKFMSYNVPLDQYLIGIFPGAKHDTKRYPIERIINLIIDVPDHWKCSFVFLGDWTDKEHTNKIRLLSEIKFYDLVGAFSVEQLVGAVSMLDVVISNDSGPMHLAAALRKPQIAIFGATHTKLGFRPLNDKAVVLQADIRCQPCSLHGGKTCKRGTFKCMRDISSDEVFSVFKNVFEEMVVNKL